MNESDSLYQQVQTCSSFPQEIYISPSSLALDGSVLDPTNGDTKTTVLFTISDEVITTVDVDPSEERIKDFTKSDVITAVPVLTTAAPTNTPVAVAVELPVSVSIATGKSKMKTKEKESDLPLKKKLSAKKQTTTAKSGEDPVESPEEEEDKAPTIGRGSSRKKPAVKVESSKDSVEESKEEEKAKAPSKSKKSRVNDDEDKEAAPEPKAPKAQKKRKDSSVEEDANKKKKAKKDPNAPKRPLTCYMLFCQEHREAVTKANPEKKVPELGKIFGSMYTDLSVEEVAAYKEKADKLKEQYYLDKAEYLDNKKTEAPCDEEDSAAESEPKTNNKKKKKVKAKKDPNAPQRAQPAYMIFCADARPRLNIEHPGTKVPEMGKILGAEWKGLAKGDKETYDQLAAIDKVRYAKEMEEYKPSYDA